MGLLLSACGQVSPKNNNDRRIGDVIEHFKTSGLAVGERSEKLASFIGASDGTGLKISGKGIEFYKFDVDVPNQKAVLEKYGREGLQMMGRKISVVPNGSFILFVEEEHPNWADIKRAFLAF